MNKTEKMTISSTNLPPAVIAGLYKQIVIPAGEAAALAELAEAHGITSGAAGAGSAQFATADEAAGSNPVFPAKPQEEIQARQSGASKGFDAGQPAAAMSSKGSDALKSDALKEAALGTDISSKIATPDTIPGVSDSSGTGVIQPAAKMPASGTGAVEMEASQNVASEKTSPVSGPATSSSSVPPQTIAGGKAGTAQEAGSLFPAGSNPSFSDDTPSSASYKILGKNLKKVVVIVRSPKEPFLPEDHLQFLTKMLGACQLNLGDVAIVNDAVQKADIQLLKAQLQPARMLLFGVAPAEIGLPLSFPQFKEQEYAGCSYLYSPSLLDLNRASEEAKDLKRKLWECLKKMFNV